jgi:hypothetical protein
MIKVWRCESRDLGEADWRFGGLIGGLFTSLYIQIIYASNLKSMIAVFIQEREQSRFKWSTRGALGEHWGSTGGAKGSMAPYSVGRSM